MTDQQLDLDEIETRAAHLHEYATLTDGPLQTDADQLTGKDVPALVKEVRRLRPALDEMIHCRDNALRALYRDDVETDIDLEETIAAPFYGPGWNWDGSDLKPVVREAAEAVRPAFGKLTEERDRLRAELESVRRIVRRLAAHAVGFGDVLDESDRGPWGRTVGADIAELSAAVAPDAASEATSAPLSASQPSSVSESAQSPTGVPTGPLKPSVARSHNYERMEIARAELDKGFTDQEWAVGRIVCPEGFSCASYPLALFQPTKRGRLPVHRHETFGTPCPGSGQKPTTPPLKLREPTATTTPAR